MDPFLKLFGLFAIYVATVLIGAIPIAFVGSKLSSRFTFKGTYFVVVAFFLFYGSIKRSLTGK